VKNGTSAIPENMKGCMDKPLFHSISICDFFIPIQHINIGVGISWVDGIFE
jgi:hypothetical protein